MPNRAPAIDGNLIAYLNPKSPGAECYRILRTNLQFLGVEKPLRSILVTSSLVDEGKTLTACNLALTMAQSGNRVTLVDTDLRRSRIHKVFRIDNRAGLTNILAGEVEVQDAVRQVHSPNLGVLTAGPRPPNPAELLGSPRMTSVLQELTDMSETVILDCPPVIGVSDGVVLSTRVDGVILVLSAKQVTYQAAQRAKSMLDQVKARLLGVVLNKVSTADDSYYYSYYYGEDDRGTVRRRR
jgi:capsular exopolysaccharide synthesis family protein